MTNDDRLAAIKAAQKALDEAKEANAAALARLAAAKEAVRVASIEYDSTGRELWNFRLKRNVRFPLGTRQRVSIARQALTDAERVPLDGLG